MLPKNNRIILKIALISSMTIGFSTHNIKAGFNTIQSAWHKLKRVVTGNTIITVNNNTTECNNAILKLKKKGTQETVLEIKIKQSAFDWWAKSFSKTTDTIMAGDYDVYLDTTKCIIPKNIICDFVVLKQSFKDKFMSYFGGSALYYKGKNTTKNEALGAGKLGEEIWLETLSIPKRGISHTYTLCFQAITGPGGMMLGNFNTKEKTILIKSGSANNDY